MLIAVTLFASCKTTEANYRAAYEKTMSGRQSDEDNETIYGGRSRKLAQNSVVHDGDTVAVSLMPVSLVTEDGMPDVSPKTYMVVAGQFKQRFNAMSLRNRLADAGYGNAFVVVTSEPYYYIVADSFDNIGEAAAAVQDLKQKSPVAMKEPLPFILQDPRKK